MMKKGHPHRIQEFSFGMDLKLTAEIHREGEWYVGFCPEVPEANGQGRTPEDCVQSLKEAILLLMEDRRSEPESVECPGKGRSNAPTGRKWRVFHTVLHPEMKASLVLVAQGQTSGDGSLGRAAQPGHKFMPSKPGGGIFGQE